jgi:hypothetical protein
MEKKKIQIRKPWESGMGWVYKQTRRLGMEFGVEGYDVCPFKELS